MIVHALNPQGGRPFSRLQRWLFGLLVTTLCFAAPVRAQVPTDVIEQECVALDYAPDGRLAYAVRRVISERRIQMQRDDIWVRLNDGKKKRIVDGWRLVQGGAPFSYAVQSLLWAPDGHHLTVEMTVRFYTNFETGETQDSFLTLLIDENGKELRIGGGDGSIQEADNATWLADGATVVYQTEAVKPKLLFSLNKVRPIAGRGASVFPRNQFVAVAYDAPRNLAVAVERDAGLTNPPELVLLDFIKETRKELGSLEAFLGKLTVSPSGKKIAYFKNHDTIEIRSLDQPAQVATVRVAYGEYAWTADETRLLIKRGVERKNSDLLWAKVPAPGATETATESALHGTPFRSFALSPDGRWLAVIEPGRQNIQIYPLQ